MNAIRKKPKGTFVERYGQGRMVVAAHGRRRSLNLQGLCALDLRTVKPDGTACDFRLESDRKAARVYIPKHKPLFLIGSPPCTAVCSWNEFIEYRYMPPEKVDSMLAEGRQHLHFMIDLHRLQVQWGRYCLREHPSLATSRHDGVMIDFLSHPDIQTIVPYQC